MPLPPPIGYDYMAINSNLSSNVGSPTSLLWVLSAHSFFLGSTNLPRNQVGTGAGTVICVCPVEVPSVLSKYSHVSEDRVG